jgi:ribosomal protein S18 acetylase RimI-like enzyme
MCSADRGEQNKLGALYILPSYQQMGIGSKLIGKALGWLGEEKPVYLEVVEYNTGAIGFYRKSGFEVEGKADDYVFPTGKSMPLLRMVKRF